MGLIVLIVLIVLGAKAEQLRWQPFAWMAALAVPALFLKIATANSNRELLGRATIDATDPGVLLGNWAANVAIWAIFYLLGFGVSKLYRRFRKNAD